MICNLCSINHHPTHPYLRRTICKVPYWIVNNFKETKYLSFLLFVFAFTFAYLQMFPSNNFLPAFHTKSSEYELAYRQSWCFSASICPYILHFIKISMYTDWVAVSFLPLDHYFCIVANWYPILFNYGSIWDAFTILPWRTLLMVQDKLETWVVRLSSLWQALSPWLWKVLLCTFSKRDWSANCQR